MAEWVPKGFSKLAADARQGLRPKVLVRELVRWFGFERRGVKVNEYISRAMVQEALKCSPPYESAFPEDELTFWSDVPAVQTNGPVISHSPAPPPKAEPYLVASVEQALQGQFAPERRVSTRLTAIERLVSYLVFAELAVVREISGQPLETARRLLSDWLPTSDQPGRPVSFGTWVDLARKLQPLVGSEGPVAEAARGLMVRGPRGAALATVLAGSIVPLRNKLAHGGTFMASEHIAADGELETTMRALVTALRPLLDGEFVCVKRVEIVAPPRLRYQLRLLHGAGKFFRTREFESVAMLTGGWAHLLLPGRGPLLLAPGFFCVEDPVSEQLSLFYARTLALDPGQKVSMVAFEGNDERRERLPG